ncbi:hypothetical protein TeGR_g7247, partial [Tetraparma gracilis]
MNTFSTGATQTCSACTDGGHSKPGSASCDRCSTGTYYEVEASQCLPCPVGTASLSGAPNIDGCDACVAGETYQSEIGQTICLPCSTCGLGEEVGLGCTVTSDTECTQCEAAYAGLGGNGTCQLCSGEREYTSVLGSPVCAQTSPGWMPNTDHTDVVKCPENTDLPGCVCPINTFLKGGECTPIPGKGVAEGVEGMTLETMLIEAGFWRTDLASFDVRACPVAAACVGGNASTTVNGTIDYCRAGHIGPYCNLCEDGYAPDAFQLCQECKTGAGDVAYTLVILVVGLVLLVGLNWALNKKVFKKNPKLKRSLKTGLKILFVSTQILAALPSIVPAIELPENYKEAVESVQ